MVQMETFALVMESVSVMSVRVVKAGKESSVTAKAAQQNVRCQVSDLCLFNSYLVF